MMHRLVLIVAIASLSPASIGEEQAPEPLDLDEALARQSATDLISAAATAYDCEMAERSFRKLGTPEKPIYMIEVAMDGNECEDAMLLLARHGSTRDFIFRKWQPRHDVEGMDPLRMPESNPLLPEEQAEPQ